MKSDIYTEEQGIERILSETKRIGEFSKLPPVASDKLRLLAEEMLSLTVRLFENLSYEYFIENEGQRFTLHLSVETLVSTEQKGKLLSLSSSGGNEATKGIFGKISAVFENLLTGSNEYAQISSAYCSDIPHLYGVDMMPYFSLSAFQEERPKKPLDEQWDGLEKSIIATLAKDMVIGVRNKRVEMIAVIDFSYDNFFREENS
ncbi:MAG: hypothetical protein FWE83_09075 [Oscillospiraceae bacterium]|nr:hypothetical protein [Oscillospiraceae bacterium]